MKKVIVFDLDGTLAESKQAIDPEMSVLLAELLYVREIGIVSGDGIMHIQQAVIDKLPFDAESFKKLYLLPTKGAGMYVFNGTEWIKLYEERLTKEDKERIRDAFEKITKEVDFLPKEHFGDVLEDRETQFTFSALGQNAPTELKREWDKDFAKRQTLKALLEKYIPEFAIEIGGTTSIDITKKNVDKGFALEQLCKYKNIPIADIMFVGDRLFPGGNDYAVTRTGVDTIAVNDYNETKDIIRKIINNEI